MAIKKTDNFKLKVIGQSTVCYYHSRDLDGWTSAAIVKKKYPDATLIGWDYGQAIPDYNEYETIILVDISFPKKEIDLLNTTKQLIWIDHHKSAIDDINNPDINGIQNTKKSACELTWDYFYPSTKCPTPVTMLGLYDSFRHKGTKDETNVLHFQYYCRSVASNPDDAEMFLTNSYDINNGVNAGKTIYDYLCVMNKETYNNRFSIDYNDKNNNKLKIALLNAERMNPVNFKIDYHNDGYDIFGSFHFANGVWNFSLYNDNQKIDVSEICKTFDGGGHKGAGGFILNDKQFLKIIDTKSMNI